MEGIKHLENALGGILAYINTAAENLAGGIQNDELDFFFFRNKRDAIHQLAKHLFVQEVVLRTIKGHASHAGSKAKLDMLKFLRVAAFGLCANFHARTAFHDGFLLPR